MHRLSVHIFRRDLRLHDNTALLQALKESTTVIPCFIFDPRQVETHDYQSKPALQFMLASLKELDADLRARGSKLYVFYGKPKEVIQTLIRTKKIDAVYLNADYTPFSKQRDAAIQKTCTKHNISYTQTHDALLTEPGTILTQQQSPYTVFTPFYKVAAKKIIATPSRCTKKNFYSKSIPGTKKIDSYIHKILPKHNPSIAVEGGRTQAKKLLRTFASKKQYARMRDIPSEASTSHLSAHHKFGTISIRETYHWAEKLDGNNKTVFRQELFWRDFFTHIAYHFPHIFEGPFRKKYAHIRWSKSKKKFEAWCTGMTGFPIVDAGMRELNTTGYMHNRVRMIVASFLVKDLHINWQWGEKYFAQMLVDYDPAVNNGNWQWAASTGCDAQPYFRIFNPWLQQKRFDPQCSYIKKRIPELSSYSAKQIHAFKETPPRKGAYPSPIVTHKEAATIAKSLFKKVA
jgi:deoxyribodipyrimidine photo-lyase